MTAGIAHEINNPLQTLSLHNESLKRYLERDENLPLKIKTQLSVIDKTINKISVMISGLKDLSREATNDPIQTFYLKDVIEEVMNVSSERIRRLGITIEIQDTSHSLVRGHFIHASQVLINLLNNSIDALENIDQKWIRIEIKDDHDYLIMSVTDSGAGIPKDIASKIMLPFFTTKEPGRGTGLGLSISKSIIERNGGKFYYDIASPVTRFVIELPIEKSLPKNNPS